VLSKYFFFQVSGAVCSTNPALVITSPLHESSSIINPLLRLLLADFTQVFNVFLVTTISGTIFQSISEIIDDPTSIAKLLAIGLPKVM